MKVDLSTALGNLKGWDWLPDSLVRAARMSNTENRGLKEIMCTEKHKTPEKEARGQALAPCSPLLPCSSIQSPDLGPEAPEQRPRISQGGE